MKILTFLSNIKNVFTGIMFFKYLDYNWVVYINYFAMSKDTRNRKTVEKSKFLMTLSFVFLGLPALVVAISMGFTKAKGYGTPH